MDKGLQRYMIKAGGEIVYDDGHLTQGDVRTYSICTEIEFPERGFGFRVICFYHQCGEETWKYPARIDDSGLEKFFRQALQDEWPDCDSIHQRLVDIPVAPIKGMRLHQIEELKGNPTHCFIDSKKYVCLAYTADDNTTGIAFLPLDTIVSHYRLQYGDTIDW